MKQTENSVEKDLIDFMQAEGWRVTRNHVGTFRPIGSAHYVHIGEEHFPDWTFTRKHPLAGHIADVHIVHVEAKASGKKPNKGQLEKIAALNYIGELATWTRNIQEFKTWYDKNLR